MYNSGMPTAFTFVPSPEHVYPDHPERPQRFDLLTPRLDSFHAERLNALPATREQIASVHSPKLVANLEHICRGQVPAVIDYAPTYVTRSSFTDALNAAGGALTCTHAVLSRAVDNAFAIVRPPGHHAEPENAMGFCLFNNIAIAVRAALEHGIERALIVDYDAHHGNGTQAAFWEEPRVAFISSHQWGIYPGTGWIDDAPHARKRIVNVPLPAYAGDRAFARIAEEIVRPMCESFRPQMLFVSAGFDAHWNDPLTSLGVSTEGFFQISKRLVELAVEHCDGRIVFVLEGGYDPQNLATGAAAVFSALTSSKSEFEAKDASPRAEPEIESRLDEIRIWHEF